MGMFLVFAAAGVSLLAAEKILGMVKRRQLRRAIDRILRS